MFAIVLLSSLNGCHFDDSATKMRQDMYVCVWVCGNQAEKTKIEQPSATVYCQQFNQSFYYSQTDKCYTNCCQLTALASVPLCVVVVHANIQTKDHLSRLPLRLRYLHLHFIAVICNAALTKPQVECIFRCIFEFHFAFYILQLSLHLIAMHTQCSWGILFKTYHINKLLIDQR